MSLDRTKYIFNDVEYGKGRLVLAVITQYVKDNHPTYSELQRVFPSELQGSVGVTISKSDLEVRKRNSTDKTERFFIKDNDTLQTSDGTKVYVSTEWGIGNIDNFIRKAKDLGYSIQEVDSSFSIELTQGAIDNGYIRIPTDQNLFDSKYIADNENGDSEAFTLVDPAGARIDTCILRNRGRLKKRFGAYFKENNITAGTAVEFMKISEGEYRMAFRKDKKSIKELYEEYKSNPAENWIKNNKERCEQVAGYKGKTPAEYDIPMLKDVWLTPANGIADASPGFMSKQEFDALLDELPEITSKIVENPSPETLDEIIVWAKQAKKENKFQTVKWGVINRVFAAASPESYSTILNENKVLELIDVLNEAYELSISTKGNWAERNISMMNAIKSQGLQDEDIFLVNTFVWRLYVSTVENNGAEQLESVTDMSKDADSAATCRNVIYYGPPGTGKTYKLQELLKDKYTDNESMPDTSSWLNSQLEDLKWHEIIILILLDLNGQKKVADIISHKYYQIKAELNERTKNLRATAWAALQAHTIVESETVKFNNRIEPLIFNKSTDSLWYIADNESEQVEEYQKILETLKSGPKQADTVKRFEFVTFHQSYGYEEFIEGLRPVTNDSGDISYEVKPGVFKKICKRAEADPDNQYVIVIDEINRGNISKIFGELITLVEIDKRAGADNQLILTLPYSGNPFSVPSNLDIIGTMNTADRSLAHIDVALRRRFDFKELRTDYSLVPENVEGIGVRRMLYAINQRIELLLDREHIIGHAMLMNVRSLEDIKNAFKANILPLLEEYFFENWEKINKVLNNNGMIEEQNGAASIWLGDSDEYAAKSFRINLAVLDVANNYQEIYSGIDDSLFEAI